VSIQPRPLIFIDIWTALEGKSNGYPGTFLSPKILKTGKKAWERVSIRSLRLIKTRTPFKRQN